MLEKQGLAAAKQERQKCEDHFLVKRSVDSTCELGAQGKKCPPNRSVKSGVF